MIFLQILAIGLVAVFCGYQVYTLVRDLKANKKKPPDNKEDKK